MSDMARMNCASHVFASLVGHKGEIPMDASNIIRKSIEAADKLIGHYQEIIEKNAGEFQARIREQSRNDEDDGAVN
jgi:hypothetical protein